MVLVTRLLRYGAAAACGLLLAGCLQKPVQKAQAELVGGTLSFPAYTIKPGELDAPAQGPYTKFSGAYPAHWLKDWQFDERFYTPGGVIPEEQRAHHEDRAYVSEFDGGFIGTPAELEAWFKEQAGKLGCEIESDPLSTTFKVIERRRLALPGAQWAIRGVIVEMLCESGPRYGDYAHFSFSLIQRIEPAAAPETPAPADPQTTPDGATAPAPADATTK
jgi:hypothetical protein